MPMLDIARPSHDPTRAMHSFLVAFLLIAAMLLAASFLVAIRSSFLPFNTAVFREFDLRLETGNAAMSGLESGNHLKHELIERFGLSSDSDYSARNSETSAINHDDSDREIRSWQP